MAERRSGAAVARTTRPKVQKEPKPPKTAKPMSATQRHKLATQGIVKAIGATDEKAAVTAALEAIHERLNAEPDYRDAFRQKYQEIAALASAPRPSDLGPAPVPIRTHGLDRYTPYGKFDPYRLVYEYGEHQLRAVLVRGSLNDLREATNSVQAREPGTKPASRTKKTDMVNYIVEKVAGTGY